jgi:hypothetical protein
VCVCVCVCVCVRARTSAPHMNAWLRQDGTLSYAFAPSTSQDFKRESDGLAKSLKKSQADLSDAQAALSSLTAERDELKRKTGGLASLEAELTTLRGQSEEFAKMSADYAAVLAKTAELDKLYRDEQLLRKKYWNMLEDMKGKSAFITRCLCLRHDPLCRRAPCAALSLSLPLTPVRVFARCRPMSDKELAAGNHSVVSFPDDMTVDLQTDKGLKSFVFDSCFGPTSTQVGFISVFPCLSSAIHHFPLQSNNAISLNSTGCNLC